MPDPRPLGVARLPAGVMLTCDVLALTLWVSGGISALGMVGVHALGTLVALRLAKASELRWALLALGVVLGPLAGLALLLAGLRLTAHDTETDTSLADEGLPPPGRAEAVYARIVEGRRFAARHRAPPSFVGVFAQGDLAAQQKALMVMARGYCPELRPALQAALASDLPAVRVQAAAVFAHLRDSYGAQARDLLAGRHAMDPQALQVCIRAVQDCGFLDAQTSRLLGDLATGSVASAAPPPVPLVRASTAEPAAPPPVHRYSCGGIA